MMDEIGTTVGTVTPATIEVMITVSNVVNGSVIVSVMEIGGAEEVPFAGIKVVFAGWRVDSTMLGMLVGKG